VLLFKQGDSLWFLQAAEVSLVSGLSAPKSYDLPSPTSQNIFILGGDGSNRHVSLVLVH